jgi:hypothetical protein
LFFDGFVGEPTAREIVDFSLVMVRADRRQKVSQCCWLGRLDDLALVASQPRGFPFTLDQLRGPHLLQNIARADVIPDKLLQSPIIQLRLERQQTWLLQDESLF